MSKPVNSLEKGICCGSVALIKTLLCLRIPTSYADATNDVNLGQDRSGETCLEIVIGSHSLIIAWIIHIYMHYIIFLTLF